MIQLTAEFLLFELAYLLILLLRRCGIFLLLTCHRGIHALFHLQRLLSYLPLTQAINVNNQANDQQQIDDHRQRRTIPRCEDGEFKGVLADSAIGEHGAHLEGIVTLRQVGVFLDIRGVGELTPFTIVEAVLIAHHESIVTRIYAEAEFHRVEGIVYLGMRLNTQEVTGIKHRVPLCCKAHLINTRATASVGGGMKRLCQIKYRIS